MAPRGERLGRVSRRSAGLRGGHSGPSGPACQRSRSGPDFGWISLDFWLPGLVLGLSIPGFRLFGWLDFLLRLLAWIWIWLGFRTLALFSQGFSYISSLS